MRPGARISRGGPGARVVRSGFTLFELALALAVLAVILGITWPSLMRFVGESGLKEDVDALRIRLGALRLRAIEQGIVYQFRFEPNGRRYLLLPAERPSGPAAADDLSSDSPADVPPAQRVQVFELEEGQRFTTNLTGSLNPVATPVTEKLPQEWLALFGGDAKLAEGSWSPAIRFDPNGTADPAAFAVEDDGQRFQTVTVRSFTGAVYIGPVERKERLR